MQTVLHDADQVETQTVNETILNKFFWPQVIPEQHFAERAIFACLSYILPYQNTILKVLGIQESEMEPGCAFAKAFPLYRLPSHPYLSSAASSFQPPSPGEAPFCKASAGLQMQQGSGTVG